MVLVGKKLFRLVTWVALSGVLKKDPNSKGGVMSFKDTLNLVMDKVDLSRKDELYEHKSAQMNVRKGDATL